MKEGSENIKRYQMIDMKEKYIEDINEQVQ